MGETCYFTQSGTTVSVYCENDCCGNQCCSTSSFDSRAFAIAMAVILGVLLLIALIVLIVYCCLKRSKRGKNKTDWRHKDVALTEMPPDGNGNRHLRKGQPNAGFFSGPVTTANILIQTGDPNPESRDRILWGRTNQWSSSHPASNRRRETKNSLFPLVESYSQTGHDDFDRGAEPFYTKPANDTQHREWRSESPPQSLLLDESVEPQDKGVQTRPRRKKAREHSKPDKPKHTDRDKQYLPAWTPVAPWRPSQQMKSLSRELPSHNPNESELFYQRNNQHSSLDSEPTGSQSNFRSRSREFLNS